MIDSTIQTELSACLNQMPVEQQRKVLEFARSLGTQPLQGNCGSDLLRFAGTIEESELELMSSAIAAG